MLRSLKAGGEDQTSLPPGTVMIVGNEEPPPLMMVKKAAGILRETPAAEHCGRDELWYRARWKAAGGRWTAQDEGILVGN